MVAYRSASGGGTGGATSFSVTAPSGVSSGDVLTALAISSGSDPTQISISGGSTWNVLAGGTTAFSQAYRLFWKSAGGSEPGSYTVSLTGSNTASCSMVCGNGGAGAAPVFAVDVSQSSTTVIDTPGVTPTGTSDLEVRFIAARGTIGNISTWTSPGALAERDDRVSGTSPAFSTSAATRTLPDGSATTSLAFTNAGTITADGGVGYTVAITSAAPQTVTPSAITSGEAFGTAQFNFAIIGQGIATGEAFGVAQVATPLAQSVLPSGIATGEAFGSLTTRLYLSPSGIASADALGVPRVVAIIGPSAITSGEAFGLTNVAVQRFITPAGVISGEAFASPVIQIGYPQTLIVEGIESGELVEDPKIFNTHRLVLVNPSIQETPVAWDRLNIRFGIHRGITIMQDELGVWRSLRYPAQTEMESAQRVYLGGRRHTITPDEANELTAAGYGAYITLEPDI